MITQNGAIAPFYCVWRVGGPAPTVKHAKRSDAISEAKRLAVDNPGSEFVVMNPLESYKVEGMTRTTYDEIPF